jgi:hypothetical protein
MTSVQFCYWLQGLFELSGSDPPLVLNAQQVEIIKKHLNMVFKHELDPALGDEEHRSILHEIHSAGPRWNPGSDKLMC